MSARCVPWNNTNVLKAFNRDPSVFSRLDILVAGKLFVEERNENYIDRYTDASAGWVMTTAILIFFMKAGFLFLEGSFTDQVTQRRRVIMTKYMDTCSSAIAFYLFGFALSTRGSFLGEDKDYIFWFFRFTFASNTATIIGGVLIADGRRMRLIAVFLYAFCSSALFHPVVANWIWSSTFAASKFCNGSYISPKDDYGKLQVTGSENDMIVLDYAGAGAVHLLGGMAGLILAFFHKWDGIWRKRRCSIGQAKKRAFVAINERHHLMAATEDQGELPDSVNSDQPEDPAPAESFLQFMYPKHGGSEHPEYAALGMLILWTTWFAFNCGSTEDISGVNYHRVTGRIALVMVLSGGAGGILAMIIALLAQMKTRGESVNTSEIANGILSCLVAVTGCGPFIHPPYAIIIGLCAVAFYHLGCFVEYKLNLHDTARVVPVHAFNGLWGMLATGIFSQRNLIQQTISHICWCISLDIPDAYLDSAPLRFGYQLLGSGIIIGWATLLVTVLFGILWLLPFQFFVGIVAKVFCLNSENDRLHFKGSFLFTEPHENISRPVGDGGQREHGGAHYIPHNAEGYGSYQASSTVHFPGTSHPHGQKDTDQSELA